MGALEAGMEEVARECKPQKVPPLCGRRSQDVGAGGAEGTDGGGGEGVQAAGGCQHFVGVCDDGDEAGGAGDGGAGGTGGGRERKD